MDTSAGSDVCINKRYILACTGSAHARSNHRFVVEALARVKVFPLWLGTGAGSAVPLHDCQSSHKLAATRSIKMMISGNEG
eukprot:scaffold137683_cov23-Tisochrysis_lutea.AAC.2